jgi:LysR family transcriptional regulator, mexEF-oprN operon transcriptional activator
MDNIDGARLRRLDLNNLVVLHTLLQTRSVSQSAAQLFIGQPAVSHVLKRLREHFNDELLYRYGRQMELTPLAQSLKQPLHDWLTAAQAMVYLSEGFDPGRATGTLKLAMPDLLEASLLPALLRDLQAQAPGVTVSIEAMQAQRVDAALEEGRIEAAVGYFPSLPTSMRRKPLFTSRFLCVYHRDRLTLPARLGIDTLIELPHVHTTYTGNSFSLIDHRLQAHGHRRRIVSSGASLLAIPALLEQIAAVAVLPDTVYAILARQHPALACAHLDGEAMDIPIELVWHPRLDQAPLQRFARALLASEASRLFGPGGTHA